MRIPFAAAALIALAALAALALAPATEARVSSAETESVLVVLAHPDDELTMAPAIAALARTGRFVTILHVTRGDAGPGVSAFPPGEELGRVRQAEADCAGKALGAAETPNLLLPDGKLGLSAHHDGNAARVLQDHLDLMIGEYDLVLTWGPDGGYGHSDHRMVSALTTQVVQAMPIDARPKLLYVGIPAGSLPPVPEMADWATTDPALLTESIAYPPGDLEAAKAAAQCHVTQFDAATRAGLVPLFDATIWQGAVHLRPAFAPTAVNAPAQAVPGGK